MPHMSCLRYNNICESDTAWENVGFISLHSINLKVRLDLFYVPFKDAEGLNLNSKSSLNTRTLKQVAKSNGYPVCL